MLNEFKGDLVEVIKASTEVLNDEDALAIVEICRLAADREIAKVSEQIMLERISGGPTPGSEQ